MRKSILTLIIGSIVSSVFIGIGAIFLSTNQDLQENGIATEAVCIGNRTSSDSDGTTYYPIVRFMTEDGQDVEAVINFGSGSPEYSEGDMVPVIYKLDNPGDSVSLNTPFWMTTFPWIFLGTGIFLNLIFVIAFLATRKKENVSNIAAKDFFAQSTKHNTNGDNHDQKDSNGKPYNPFRVD